NKMSHQCFDFGQVQDLLQKILSGKIGAANGDERKALIGRYLASLDGPLACERMVDVLEKLSEISSDSKRASLTNRLERWTLGKGLQMVRGIKSSLPGSHNKPEFQRHRYPDISLQDVKAKVSRLQQLLGINEHLKIEQVSEVMFRIN
ncbi:MAG: hypothetical protein JSV83_05630, partial [Desulfobacterales bacterium]